MNGFTNRTAKGPSEDSFVRGFGLQSLGRTEVGGLAGCASVCPGMWPREGPICLPGKLAFWVPTGDDGGHSQRQAREAEKPHCECKRCHDLRERAPESIFWVQGLLCDLSPLTSTTSFPRLKQQFQRDSAEALRPRSSLRSPRGGTLSTLSVRGAPFHLFQIVVL